MADGKKPDCKDLEKKNIDERESFIKKMKNELRETNKNGLKFPKDKRRALVLAERTGMTYSSAVSAIPNAGGVATQSSSGLANKYITTGGKGGTGAQKVGLSGAIRNSPSNQHTDAKSKAGTLCNFRRVHPGGGYGGHAECKIFNDLTNQVEGALRGGSVLLSIDWRPKNLQTGTTEYHGTPCSTCYDMLCEAANECNIEILICDHQNKPQPMSKSDCKKPGGYRKLVILINGRAKGGRLKAPGT
ncbi:hypothetical protein [Pseudomonas sp. RW409]|uniref:hypothetical protein n=1 Tax=Pseudomonas sp. RW409 TaxID=2202895 RepID=UPI000D72E863|nr:hypothetical protein [Pseudomonas sp. RW409]PWY36406.1 hypothetical protein DK261_28285 [Pseudomonas sp. RW409]